MFQITVTDPTTECSKQELLNPGSPFLIMKPQGSLQKCCLPFFREKLPLTYFWIFGLHLILKSSVFNRKYIFEESDYRLGEGLNHETIFPVHCQIQNQLTRQMHEPSVRAEPGCSLPGTNMVDSVCWVFNF